MSTVRITGPGDLAASLPALLGFHPEQSLVAVLLDGSRVVCTMRMEMPDDLTVAASTLIEVIDRAHGDRVLLAVYTSRGRHGLPWQSEITDLIRLLRPVPVTDALLIDAGRWWSYLCDDPTCCPPQGTPIPDSTTELEAERVGAGMPAVASSRDDLAARYQPRPDLAPSTEAFQAVISVVDRPLKDRCQVGLDTVRALSRSGRIGISELDAILRARLILLVRDVNVRDYILGSVAASQTDATALADGLVRTALTAPERLRPPVAAAAAALVAALGGDAVAVHALIDLGQEENLAQLVQTAINAGIPPAEIRGLLVGCLPVVEQRAREQSA